MPRHYENRDLNAVRFDTELKQVKKKRVAIFFPFMSTSRSTKGSIGRLKKRRNNGQHLAKRIFASSTSYYFTAFECWLTKTHEWRPSLKSKRPTTKRRGVKRGMKSNLKQ